MATSRSPPDSHEEMSFTVEKHLYCAMDVAENEEVTYHLRQALQKIQVVTRDQ